MRCLMATGPEHVELRRAAVPVPGPGEVLIRVRAVGICGSDVHLFAGRLQKEFSYPFVLGHEFSGEVAALGTGVDGVEVGARVACAPDRPCGKCEWCKKGETNVCPNVKFAASHGEPGCLCDYFIVDQKQIYPMPDSLSFEQAALFEPAALGLHIVENLARPQGGESYAVMGAGPDGLAVLCVARANDAGAVYVSDLIAERLDAALKLGADVACNAAEQDFLALVLERTGGRGVDVAVEAAGAVPAIQQAFPMACIHGKAIVMGIPPVDKLEMDLTAARRRELTFIACRRTVGKYTRALEMIDSGQIDAGVIVTHTFPIEKAQQAFECAHSRADGVIKAMIQL